VFFVVPLVQYKQVKLYVGLHMQSSYSAMQLVELSKQANNG